MLTSAGAVINLHRRTTGCVSAIGISVLFTRAGKAPVSAGAGLGKGGGAYPAYGTLLIPANAWLDGHGVNVYSNGADGNANGNYQCVELVNRLT